MQQGWMGVAALGLAAMFLGGCQPSPRADAGPRPQGSPAPSAVATKPAPDFTLTGLDGKVVKLSELRGKPVVIDFWATWCPPCKKGLPAVQRLHQKYGDKLVVLAVAVDDEAAVRPFVKEQGLTLPVLLGTEEVGKAYGVEAIPTTVFIGKDGAEHDRLVGLEEDEDAALQQRADKLL